MPIEPPKDPQFHWQWWHIALGFLGLTPGMAFKKVREFLFGWLKRKVEEEDCMPRAEFEDRIKGITDDLKGRVTESEGRILEALKDNVSIIREDQKTEREFTEKRLQFLEKVFLDSRLAGK